MSDMMLVMSEFDSDGPSGDEWSEWGKLTPVERFQESMKLWETYLALGAGLSPSPILRALSSIRKSGVKTSRFGGHAYGLYGAARKK